MSDGNRLALGGEGERQASGADLTQLGGSGGSRVPANFVQGDIGRINPGEHREDSTNAPPGYGGFSGEPVHTLGFLRDKVGGYISAKGQHAGYPLRGGSAAALASGDEAPVGHTFTAQVVQAPTPPIFGAGDRASASAVPAIYAGNPDLTTGPA